MKARVSRMLEAILSVCHSTMGKACCSQYIWNSSAAGHVASHSVIPTEDNSPALNVSFSRRLPRYETELHV